jgi:acyl-CoA dehydrogenase
LDFSLTDRESHFRDRVREFMENEVRPRGAEYARELVTGDRWAPLPTIDALKSKAKAAGLAIARTEFGRYRDTAL